MAEALDLEAYLQRIQWRGERSPTYNTLAGVISCHVRHIPFENFDVLLGLPIRLDVASLTAKLVDARRGGYCFEHASLAAAALEAMGFAVQRHLARVVLFQPLHEAPRGHMFLTVETEGRRFVLDPGFGSFASQFPIPLDGSATPDRRWMIYDDGMWTLGGQRKAEQFTGWASPMEVDHPIDLEMSNHFQSTHPDSVFRQRIFGSAITPYGRINLMNRTVTLVSDERETASELAHRGELRGLLAQHFGFDLPDVDAIIVPGIAEWA